MEPKKRPLKTLERVLSKAGVGSRHVPKTYLVKASAVLTDTQLQQLRDESSLPPA